MNQDAGRWGGKRTEFGCAWLQPLLFQRPTRDLNRTRSGPPTTSGDWISCAHLVFYLNLPFSYPPSTMQFFSFPAGLGPSCRAQNVYWLRSSFQQPLGDLNNLWSNFTKLHSIKSVVGPLILVSGSATSSWQTTRPPSLQRQRHLLPQNQSSTRILSLRPLQELIPRRSSPIRLLRIRRIQTLRMELLLPGLICFLTQHHPACSSPSRLQDFRPRGNNRNLPAPLPRVQSEAR